MKKAKNYLYTRKLTLPMVAIEVLTNTSLIHCWYKINFSFIEKCERKNNYYILTNGDKCDWANFAFLIITL